MGMADNDDDTSYNVAGTSSLIDLYTYPALTTTAGTVYAVMTVAVLRNDAAGTVTTVPEYRQSSTNYTGATDDWLDNLRPIWISRVHRWPGQ